MTKSNTNRTWIAFIAVGNGTGSALCTWNKFILAGKCFYFFTFIFSLVFMDDCVFRFVCETCAKTKGIQRPENRYTAKRLPQCKLSQHLEKRVNDFLKKRLPPEQPSGEVVIRVLSSSDKEVEVKPLMKNKSVVFGISTIFSQLE